MHRLRRWGEAGNAALAAGLSALFGFLVIQPWDGDFDVPYLNVADANLYRSEVKGILEHGWYWHNPNLGAPEGQQLFDFPGLSGDPLNVLLMEAHRPVFLGRGGRGECVLPAHVSAGRPRGVPRVPAADALGAGRDRVLDPLHDSAVPLLAGRAAPAPLGLLRRTDRGLPRAGDPRRPFAVRRAATDVGDAGAVRGGRVRFRRLLLRGVHVRARCGGRGDQGGRDAELEAARCRAVRSSARSSPCRS